MACSHIKGCELFVQFALNPALDVWKEHYCYGDFGRCMRFQMSKAGRPVPLTLLPNGKLVDSTGPEEEPGAAALFNSIIKRRTRMVHSLIRAGANVNATNTEGMTALMAAARIGAEDIARLLADAGADLDTKTFQGETAYDIAVRCGHKRVAQLLASYQEPAAASSAG